MRAEKMCVLNKDYRTQLPGEHKTKRLINVISCHSNCWQSIRVWTVFVHNKIKNHSHNYYCIPYFTALCFILHLREHVANLWSMLITFLHNNPSLRITLWITATTLFVDINIAINIRDTINKSYWLMEN